MDRNGDGVRSGWSPQEWADWFRKAYREVLLQGQDSASPEWDYWRRDALDVYRILSEEAKALLKEEAAALESYAGAEKKEGDSRENREPA